MSRRVPVKLTPEDYETGLEYLKATYSDDFIRHFVLELSHVFATSHKETLTSDQQILLARLEEAEIANTLLHGFAEIQYNEKLRAFEEKQRAASTELDHVVADDDKVDGKADSIDDDEVEETLEDLSLLAKEAIDPPTKPNAPSRWLVKKSDITAKARVLAKLSPSEATNQILAMATSFHHFYKLAYRVAIEQRKGQSARFRKTSTRIGAAILSIMTGAYSTDALAQHIEDLSNTGNTFSSVLNALRATLETNTEETRGLEVEVSKLTGTVEGVRSDLKAVREQNTKLDETIADLGSDLTAVREQNTKLDETIAGFGEEIAGLHEKNDKLSKTLVNMTGVLTDLNESMLMQKSFFEGNSLDTSVLHGTGLFHKKGRNEKYINAVKRRIEPKRWGGIIAIVRALHESHSESVLSDELIDLLQSLLEPTHDTSQENTNVVNTWLAEHGDDVPKGLAIILDNIRTLPAFCINDEGKEERYFQCLARCFQEGIVLPKNSESKDHFNDLRPSKRKDADAIETDTLKGEGSALDKF